VINTLEVKKIRSACTGCARSSYYNRICVMDQGRNAELDTPYQLYLKGGIFSGMCDRSSIRMEDFEGR
jgi:hypothetical protein